MNKVDSLYICSQCRDASLKPIQRLLAKSTENNYLISLGLDRVIVGIGLLLMAGATYALTQHLFSVELAQGSTIFTRIGGTLSLILGVSLGAGGLLASGDAVKTLARVVVQREDIAEDIEKLSLEDELKPLQEE